MTPQGIFSWSKRPSSSEQYYRVGGLLPIATEEDPQLGDSIEVETDLEDEIQQPSPLKIIRAKKTPYALSTASTQYYRGRDSATSSLQAAFDDLLRSPTACKRPADLQKPLPSRPRSTSVPIIPELPAELPGSLLLENQGYPSKCIPLDSPPRGSPSPKMKEGARTASRFGHEGFLRRSNVAPESIAYMTSVPDLSAQHDIILYARSCSAFDSTSAAGPSPLDVLHESSRAGATTRPRSRPGLGMASSSIENLHTFSASGSNSNSDDTLKRLQSRVAAGNQDPSSKKRRSRRPDSLSVCVTPTPTTTRSKQIRDLKTSTPSRDHTTLTPQAQCEGLRPSNQSHAKVTSREAYARSLEVPELHHSSSDDFLFLFDTFELPQTPTREFLNETAGTVSSNSTPSFQSLQEKQERSEMDSLKRKLSGARRPENSSRNLLPELNLYKQNNIALQKQIELLMAKLSDSKRREREAQAAREQAEYERAEWEFQAEKASRLSKNERDLQNTTGHPDSRRAMTNSVRLEAEEQPCDIRVDKSPLDVDLHDCRDPMVTDPGIAMAIQKPHISISTISKAPSNFVASKIQEFPGFSVSTEDIERLQNQIKQKDIYIVDLGREGVELRRELEQLKVERDEATLRSEIQADLLQKTQRSDTYIESLRSAVFDREAIIAEREKSLRSVERQLALHKLLLQAEIRRHATAKLKGTGDDDTLPAITTLAKQEDIDRWMSNLHRRLLKDQLAKGSPEELSEHEAELRGLRQEIEFYVREIIYYKLDIRGYKNDIRKLKRVTTLLGSHGNRASDLDSESSSLQPMPTPNQGRFASAAPEPGPSNTTSPIMAGSMSKSPLISRPSTPKTQHPEMDAVFTPPKSEKRIDHQKRRADLEDCAIPQKLGSKINLCYTNEAGNDGMPSPTPGLEKPSLETRKPISQIQETQPVTSESRPNFGAMSDTPQRSHSLQSARTARSSGIATARRRRSASIPCGKASPEHPPHPPFLLYRFSNAPSKPSIDPSQASEIDILADKTQLTLEKKPIVSSSRPGVIDGHNPSLLGTVVPKDLATKSKTDKTATRAFSAPVRKLNVISGTSAPLAIAMASPHNHGLVTPATNFRPSACSITRNAPLKVEPPNTRPKISGSVASSSPVKSSMQLSNASNCMPPPKTPSVQSVRSVFALPFREIHPSTQTPNENFRQREPRTPSHSRTVSGSSIRTAIRLPKLRDKSNQKARIPRNDSIGSPNTFGNSLGVERSMSLTSAGRKTGVDKAL